MGDRCTGRCCQAFHIHRSLDDIAAMARADGSPYAAEHSKLAAMLLPIERVDDCAPAIGRVSGGTVAHGWWYTCRHYDDLTSNCDAYEDRPDMCRDYPYGRRCEFARCTWSPVLPAVEQSSDGRRHLVVLMPDNVRTAFENRERELLAKAADVRAAARQKAQVP